MLRMKASSMIAAIVLSVLMFVAVPRFIAGGGETSPQTVEIMNGATATVAGGRAKIWFAGGSTGTDFDISCGETTETLSPGIDETVEACGLKITVKEIKTPEVGPIRGVFKLEWDEAAGAK